MLAWFERCSLPAQSRPLELTTIQQRTQANRPGLGQPGTANWRWHGRQLAVLCPPLEREALLVCALAVPATDAFSLSEAFAVWQALATLALLCAQEEPTLLRAWEENDEPPECFV